MIKLIENSEKMKTLLTAIILIIGISSCTELRQIGKVNMISNRNIESSKNYKLISTYAGGNEKDLKRSKAKSLEQAIDETVMNTAGGEYLMNAKIYVVNAKYFAVVGDVWGLEGQEKQIQGFKEGDHITWKTNGKYKTGTIITLEDGETCLARIDNDTEVKQLKYVNISKIKGIDTSDKFSQTQSIISGFKVSDLVMWKSNGTFLKGRIEGLGNDYAIVSYKDDRGNGKTKEVSFSRMTKVNEDESEKDNPKPTIEKSEQRIESKISEQSTAPVKYIAATNPEKIKIEGDYYTIDSDNVNIRNGASGSASPLFKAKQGDVVELLEKTNEYWWKVKHRNGIGYISAKFLIRK